MVKVASAILLLLLAGCSLPPIQLGLPCTVGPFITDKNASERWTRSELEQLVALNNSGQILCRWTAPKKSMSP